MNSNVINLEIPNCIPTSYEMPSLNGVTSNVMTYTDRLFECLPVKANTFFLSHFGTMDVDTDWCALPFNTVEAFLRDCYGRDDLKLVRVARCTDDPGIDNVWELFFFMER